MNPNQNEHSHLFLVRFWSEMVGGRNGWQGRVQDVRSGEARIFHDWPTLIDLLLEMAETEAIDTEIGNNKTGETQGGLV
jgi:hypothetical protein